MTPGAQALLPTLWQFRPLEVVHAARVARVRRLAPGEQEIRPIIIEAAGAEALARGMQGLAVWLARGLNRVMDRSGTLAAERYHARELKTSSSPCHRRRRRPRSGC